MPRISVQFPLKHLGSESREMVAVKSKRAKHSAPGQYLGFGLQPIRMCYHLLTAPAGSQVSLEHDDDVAVHRADGATILEQTKSALSHNPLSDWAEDLWKAIANWLDSTSPPDTGDPPIYYRLYVVPQHEGAFAGAMNAADTPQAVAAFVEEVSSALAALKKKPKCLASVKRFLDAPRPAQIHLISNLSIESNTADPVEPIRELIKLTVAHELIDTICNHAIGSAKQQAEALMRAGRPGVLDVDDFKVRFRHFVKRANLPALLPFSGPPPAGAVESMLAGRPTFIRQLELIDAPEDQRIVSVGDYLRASADKTHWAEAGLVFPDALAEWDSTLLKQHEAIRDEVEITEGALDVKKRGQLLYARCRQLRRPLDGREVADHFIHGSFHDLSDRRKIGWHADFDSLLDKDE